MVVVGSIVLAAGLGVVSEPWSLVQCNTAFEYILIQLHTNSHLFLNIIVVYCEEENTMIFFFFKAITKNLITLAATPRSTL